MKLQNLSSSIKLKEVCYHFDELKHKLKNKKFLLALENLCEEGIAEFWNGVTLYYMNGSYFVDNPKEDEVVEVETLKELYEVLREFKAIK
jgi:hypothetical protein